MKNELQISLASLFTLFFGITLAVAAPQPIQPLNSDGKPLNFDFEDGSLKDWVATGSAFDKQPVRGDLIARRNGPGGTSAHHGEFWIGGYEISGDGPQGALTSVPFKVAHPFASFLIAGGSHPETRVELATAADQKVFFKTSANDTETLRPVVVDLKAQKSQEIIIRIVDEHSGGWGHVNFDNFVFYDERPEFPNEMKKVEPPPADAVLYNGLSAEDAAKKMSLPPGFKATLFAGEPDVQQPIAFAIDDRGRLWVAEGYTYPIRQGTAPPGKSSEPTPEQLKDIFGGKDRILVFEDTDGDGKFNKRTVVAENLNLVSGIEIGFGGVFVGAAPYLMFLPIADWDNPKAGTPQILLDGFAYHDTHETLNTFTWGPDGWLYGCHGVFTHSVVGKPGAPDSERVRINAGVWRYHPTKKVFELFAEGTSNPWGIDFDEHGQCITEACVIPHLFHMIQGGRFHRQAGSHFNPYAYDDIKTIADHVHWAGDKGPHAGNGRSAAAGGGHAHAGLLVYQGDNWPEEYRGKVFIGNIHGACINEDILERKGSGFVDHHAPNMIDFNDTWSQVLNMETGPDGAVYMIDWYDKNQCHHNDPNGHDRSNGRIFKISYGQPKFERIDLQKLGNRELVHFSFMKNVWYSRHANRILQERAIQDKTLKNPGEVLTWLGFGESKVQANAQNEELDSKTLRLLWAAHVTGSLDGDDMIKLLSYKPAFIRAWAIQLLCEDKKVSSEILNEFARLAREDKSPVVRLYLASALRRIPADDRWEILQGLYAHAEDIDDHNLPLMYWYAAEASVGKDTAKATALLQRTKIPLLRQFIARRITAKIDLAENQDPLGALVQALQQSDDSQLHRDALKGISEGLQGRRSAKMPPGWDDLSAKLAKSSDAEIRALNQSLSLTFGSQNALASLRKILTDSSADAGERRSALESLLAIKDPSLAPLLRKVLPDANLQGPALRGLAAYDDGETPAAILAVYNSLDANHKRDALSTLCGRVAFAKPLLAAIESEKLSHKDLSADLVRQLRTLKNEDLNKSIEKVWGAVHESSADKKATMEKYRKIYWAGGSQPGDASRGRALFAKTCGGCHTLFDAGGKVGPELTGSNRGDLNYLLENIVDPNAVIPNDYRASTIEMKDDRVLTAIIKKEDENAVTAVTQNETLVLPRKEIASIQQSQLSMMPEGLLDQLSEQEVRDLLYYLSRPGQVPLPQEAKK